MEKKWKINDSSYHKHIFYLLSLLAINALQEPKNQEIDGGGNYYDSNYLQQVARVPESYNHRHNQGGYEAFENESAIDAHG